MKGRRARREKRYRALASDRRFRMKLEAFRRKHGRDPDRAGEMLKLVYSDTLSSLLPDSALLRAVGYPPSYAPNAWSHREKLEAEFSRSTKRSEYA